MATKSISQLDTQATANETDLFEVAIVDANSASGYASKKESAAAIADAIVGEYQYPLRITGTTAKTIAGAINELKNLVDLLPQFAIEVVQTLPVSDISETTIYLVPASDPEQGNYYEEYIYVNNAWELVGTTAVDLSGYYTSAQVDTLLAAKANTSSLATVATSGAYSDLTGKPTIDTALDDTSTNAVENRAVAGEINSIKSDITVDGSASGDIATFVDGSDNPLKALKISIVAQQSGTGDPSPTNVRPITGWTGANVYCKGINVFDKTTIVEGKRVNNTGALVDGTDYSVSDFIAVRPNTSYYLMNVINATYYITCATYDKDYTFISNLNVRGASSIASGTITTPANAYYLRINTLTAKKDECAVNYPATDTAYHAYTGTTININWQSVAGTVYGGQLNVKTGVLTATYGSVDMDTLDYTYLAPLAAQGTFPFTVENRLLTSSDIMSNKLAKSASSNWDDIPDNSIRIIPVSTQNTMRVRISTCTTVEVLKTALSGVVLVYPLATPVTYQLTPTEIRSLLGLNNVFANCGAITELKYTRDLNLCINDIIARIEALEGGSNTRSLSVSPTLTKSLTSDSDATEGKTEEETEEETKEEAQQNER